PIIGIASVRVARRLGPIDFRRESGGPFRPGEKAALVQGQGHREGLRLPGLAKYRAAFLIARQAGDRNLGNALHGTCAQGVVKYGSNASIDTLIAGSASSPHSSRPVKTT